MTTRPYQGYLYSNPHVIDAPSVDAAAASRWDNLPRRPVQPPSLPRRNVVYVDLPEEGSQVSRPNYTSEKKPEPDPADAPVIYIDLPESSISDVTGPAKSKQAYQTDDTTSPSNEKPDPEPMIYIDVPEDSSSDVAGPALPEPEPEYVQETIFYNPFEDRRIYQPKPSDSSETQKPSTVTQRQRPPRPALPRTLDLHGASGSPAYGSSFGSLPTEAYGLQDDELNLSPLSVTPYPVSPPAYSEINTPRTTNGTPQTPGSTLTEPPRTIVITPGHGSPSNAPVHDPSPIGLASPNRKVVHCQHCGLRVHTLVIYENGPVTHAIALALLCLMFLPLVVLVYWSNYFKYQNHYCPNCNKKIGYEIPGLRVKMCYIATSTHVGATRPYNEQ